MSFRRRTFLAPILALLSSLAPVAAVSQSPDAGHSIAITGVTVVPMDVDRLIENQTVIITDGVISSISDTGATTLASGTTIINGEGRYLMPGLADLHVHILHEDDLVNYLSWGVTTIMHLGGSGLAGPEILEFRDRAIEGRLPAPNIYTTNRVLDGDPRLNSRSVLVTDPQTAREEVRKLKAGGYDFVKIYNNIAQREFEAIVDEAGKLGLPVFGHIPRKFNALLALSGGQDTIAHSEELFFSYFDGPRSTDDGMPRNYLPDMTKLAPLTEAMLANEVATMPDLSFTFTDLLMWDDLELLWNDSEFAYLHPRTVSTWQAGSINRRSGIENFVVREQWKYELILDLTKHFQEAGILQVIGTDAALPGLYPGKAAHRELTELVKAGLTRFQALAVGTRNAGEFVRRYIDDNVRFGQVLPGYRADLVLVEENPLDDIRNARMVAGVIVNGRYFGETDLGAYRAELRQRYDYLRSMSNAVATAFDGDNVQSAVRAILQTGTADDELLALIESQINAAGYSAAYADNLVRAREILQLNTELFPDSANAWDSFAEVTLYMGDRERALELYRRALQVDPDFSNAAEQIEKIEAEQQD